VGITDGKNWGWSETVMDIRYSQGDFQIGSVVVMAMDTDMRGMITGIQFLDNGFSYLVTYIINGAPTEYFQRPTEIRKAK